MIAANLKESGTMGHLCFRWEGDSHQFPDALLRVTSGYGYHEECSDKRLSTTTPVYLYCTVAVHCISSRYQVVLSSFL
jgi:hypothetical protein